MAEIRTIRGAVPIALDTPAPPGAKFVVNATVAGNVSVTFRDGSAHVMAVPIGYTAYDYEIRQVNTAGTTATATYANLV